ncbi:MAG: GDP-mannose pyrophosphatase NudK [uncultured Paraburkholderia sp.]|nr:MAG: GDP-mannose pyrophosphatase NudK [uncultured Paraburkholderia sp.]CAH2933366.1 MAG: GDP-mannose pyrophosphatase NudK [uncultured Paraburkholderia sp.]
MNDTTKRVRIVDVEVLSDNWYVLKKTTFDFRRADGTRAAKPTTAATAPRCCSIARANAPSC